MTDEPRATLLFCDDLRHEVGGKMSALGIYQGFIGLSGDTLHLAKMCVLATLELPLNASGTVAVTIGDRGKELVKLEADIPDRPVTPPALAGTGIRPQLIVPVELVPFDLQVGMRLQATVSYGEWSATAEMPVVAAQAAPMTH